MLSEEISVKQRLVTATARIFAEEGYEAVSMRRVAAEAGYSQMAAYRHFESKEALIQHVCADLYQQFATRMMAEMAKTDDPWKKIHLFAAALLRFALQYPDHYSLIFLVRHPDPKVIETRESLARGFLAGVRETVSVLLPPETRPADVDAALRRMMASAHGTMALLLAHPQPYALNRTNALRDLETTFGLLLGRGQAGSRS
ncbi:TetR family transcriptional regulator [Edaphobacter modestus]|uniref:TetR family transcriptional regulator n=2 Tax=Edaphobacter modestus TaxID=388466 RepID=A0A4Q7YU26_9BACT|nr:TetR family transcriptional regulator [Edaphobacter modestus]